MCDRWPLVVKLSDQVEVEWFRAGAADQRTRRDIGVSGIGTIAATRVAPRGRPEDSFVVASMYARYMKPHPSTGTPWRVGAADVSAHRILSDLSAFIRHENPAKHRILAAGDLNIIYGATGGALSLPAGRHEERPDLLQPAAALAGQYRPPNRAGGSSGCCRCT